MADSENCSRRNFLRKAAVAALGAGGIAALAGAGKSESHYVWQINPYKCIQCGLCATSCVLGQSAVKCVHSYSICGRCGLCYGYFDPEHTEMNTAAENQLCPTGAITRKHIEDIYYEYHIDEEKCIGCGKCVAGCTAFGNGSLYLQIRHNVCVNCNQCAIATACPANAFERIPASKGYNLKINQEAKE